MMLDPRPRRPGLRFALLAALVTLPLTHVHAAVNNRLEREVVPTSQAIRLKLDPARPDYSGAVRIELEVRVATPSFRLYAKDMDVIQVRLAGPAGAVTVAHEAGPHGQLLVRAGEPLTPGAYALEIDFMNDFGTRANSLYRVKSGEDWYCYTQFEPVAAREAFPCWDEPEFKIPFQLTVTVPEKSRAVSNSPVGKESSVGGQKTVVFKRTPPLPSYLVAIAVGPFDMVPIRGMSVPGSVVTVRGLGRLAGEAAAVTPPLLAALEKYFGRPYPYEKLDLLAVPEFSAGAMENAGAVTYREEILLVDPATASVQQRYRLASTTAHELAHMWFGDLVTMDWWDDLWLNESFASWMGDKVTHQVFPRYNVPVRQLGGTRRAMETDARPSTRPVRQSVDAFANLDRLFDELAYQKGQAVLAMLETWLGPEVFRQGIIAYLKAHEWKNATAADLWRALSEAAGRDITPVTLAFLDQGGVPLVSLETLPDGAVRLRQQRFLHHGVEARGAAQWAIPVTLRYSDGHRVHTQSVLLDAPEKTVRLEKGMSPAWIHPNASERGYYRWQVPPAMLETLAGTAGRTLEERERVGFLHNLTALLDAGHVRGDDYLRTLERFADDPAPEVVTALIGGIEKLYASVVTPDLRGFYSILVRRMLGPSLARFGMTPAKGEPEPVALMRPGLLQTLGVYGYEREVLDWAGVTARRYLERPQSVDPSLAGAALQLAARDGDMALYERYRARFEQATVPAERARFLAALGHFRTGVVLVHALDYALTGPLRPQEIFVIAQNVAEDEEMRERIWRWFRSGYRVIVRRVPPSYLPRLPNFAQCCDLLRIDEAKALFELPETNYPGTSEELAKVIDRIRDCAALKEREHATVARYLMETARRRPAPAPAAGP